MTTITEQRAAAASVSATYLDPSCLDGALDTSTTRYYDGGITAAFESWNLALGTYYRSLWEHDGALAVCAIERMGIAFTQVIARSTHVGADARMEYCDMMLGDADTAIISDADLYSRIALRTLYCEIGEYLDSLARTL